MAASDPTTGVPTPTGVLQGVAAFSWDGSNWQPSGCAGPSVATPTGVLRGVAPFSYGGGVWTPTGRAGPGVPTPTGVLDGVAVYTWSGSAWTPSPGGPDTATPTGTLQGIAAFYWDGTNWQPTGQAGPDVATPSGVLQGVAMFSWSGSAWAAASSLPSGVALDANFMVPGTLPTGVTFTRGSTATYFDATGTMQTAATNAPRWDYNPATLALNGLLIEEARTNLALQSGNVFIAPWVPSGGGGLGGPGNAGSPITAPDGVTSVSRLAYTVVSSAAQFSVVEQPITATANIFAFTAWFRGAVGGEQLYLMATPDGVLYYRQLVTLTTTWQRFTLITSALTAATWYFQIGVDLRDASQTAKPLQNLYVWGAQIEQGAFPTSYIPTTAAAVTRSADVATIASIPGRNAAAETWQAEFIFPTLHVGSQDVIGGATVPLTPLYIGSAAGSGPGASWDGVGGPITTTDYAPGSIGKIASTWASPNNAAVCLNAGVIAASTAATAGYSAMTSIQLGRDSGGNIADGWIRRVRYWPRVLTNTELQQVTT